MIIGFKVFRENSSIFNAIFNVVKMNFSSEFWVPFHTTMSLKFGKNRRSRGTPLVSQDAKGETLLEICNGYQDIKDISRISEV